MASAQPEAVDPDLAIIDAIAQPDHCTRGKLAIQRVMSRDDFDAMPERQRGYIFFIAAFCAVQAKSYDAAYELSVHATKAFGDVSDVWR
ncbi:hypothetical protein [Novosphingobium sp. 9U]|uniref:hypothetical protein n=1 Tax=Novosphingobium sp. 9U TaxID=2653158 RepID=UPI0012F337EB|nr:hypothetical protein [Novosphingobium sp. 9U]VWX54625.1 hypothetical protein NOVOSPHI9U_690005 [Novosphingobium sp. 9U]